jgi:beta-lactamase regulating signal transducer with metallopeptidase domain
MNHLEAAAHWAWNTSLAASVLIIPALLFSLLFRHPRFTPIRHMLGLLIVARLLLPVSLPSPLSIFNLIKPQPTVIAHVAPPTIVAAEVTRLTPPPANKHNPITSAAHGIWILGVVILLTRVAIQHIKVRRWLTANNRITHGAAFEALNSALTLSNCRRRVALYSVNGLSTPALFGLLRPAILLPADLAKSNDAARLRLVCLHELAHLQRMDVLINWLMIIAQSLHWFNPFVWLTLRRLRADQELLCDEHVMRHLHPEEHHTYGETLLALASPRTYSFSTLIPVSSNFKQLKERIAMIKQFKPATRRILVFTLPPLAALLAMLTFTGATNEKAPPSERAANGPVATVKALDRQFAIETDRVRLMESKVDNLRKELNVFAVTEGDLLKESQTLQQMETDRARAESEYLQSKELVAELKKKNRDDLIYSIPAAYRDEALQRLIENLQKSEQNLAIIRFDYSEDHAEVRRLTALIKTINKQLDDRVKGMLSSLESTAASRRAVVDILTKQLQERKRYESEALERARPYFTAKRDLETHQKMRDSIYLRLLEAKADSEMKRASD